MRNPVLLLVMALVPCANAFDLPADMTASFGNRELLPIEGVWYWTSGAVTKIEADSFGNIVITLADCDDPLVDTPKVIGTGRFTGKTGTYDIELYTDKNGVADKNRPGTIRMIAKVNDSQHLSFHPYSSKLKFNLRHLLPYFFRFSVSREKEPDGLEGAVRVWPDTGSPEFPVIL